MRRAVAACALLAGTLGAPATTRAEATIPLVECERAALARSPAAHAALLAAAAAAQRVRSARAAYWPTLAIRGDYGVAGGFDTAVTNGGQTDALVSLEALILDGGARSARLRAAQADVRSTAAKEAQERADVLFAVRIAYVQAVAAEAARAVHDRQLDSLRRYGDVLARLEAAGLVPRTDRLRAGLAVTAVESARRASDADAMAARAALAIVTGLEVETARLVPPDLHAVTPTPAMIDQAPVVMDAHAASESAQADVDVARSERASQLRLTADAGALGVRPGETFRRDGGGQFMLGFALPVFDGGVVQGRIAAAEATSLAAAARVDQARELLQVELARNATEARRAGEDVAAARRALDVAEAQEMLMRARYLGGGDVRLVELLDAVAAEADARLAVPRAELAQRTAGATQAQILGEAPP